MRIPRIHPPPAPRPGHNTHQMLMSRRRRRRVRLSGLLHPARVTACKTCQSPLDPRPCGHISMLAMLMWPRWTRREAVWHVLQGGRGPDAHRGLPRTATPARPATRDPRTAHRDPHTATHAYPRIHPCPPPGRDISTHQMLISRRRRLRVRLRAFWTCRQSRGDPKLQPEPAHALLVPPQMVRELVAQRARHLGAKQVRVVTEITDQRVAAD